MRRQVRAIMLMLLCVWGLMWGENVCKAFAAEPLPEEDAFSGEVSVLKQESDRYVMQVTVGNDGEDFVGTVQVIFGANYDNCAYNTEITLPAQGKKQFTITVPDETADTAYGACQINFLDSTENVVQSISLRDVFRDMQSGISVGVLSDRYSDIGFMDAEGLPFDIRGVSYPLQLLELDNDNLSGYLNGLYFLIIDQFNTSSLSDENIQAIQDWVQAGGWLILGTGAYAEQTLSGFDGDFLDVEVKGISEPGEENPATVNAEQYGYYYSYVDEAGIDFSQMAVAELDYFGMYAYGGVSESVENPGVNCPVGDGSVFLLYFSLGEKELQKVGTSIVRSIYSELMYNSNSYRSLNRRSDMQYAGQRALAFIDGRNSDVDFSLLEVLIGVYVVLVGPVLYLILRKCKKREWYWVGAPALGILFIAGVFLFGRGLSVKDTRVYSVTVQQAEGKRADTYMMAYHAGVKPWEMRLDEAYDVAGPGFLGYSYYSSSSTINDYHYIVDNGSRGLSVGIKPRENFENGFFYAGKKTESVGGFTGTELVVSGIGRPEGTVTNATGHDMTYMAVWGNAYIMILSDVKAGETIDLQQAARNGRCVYEGTVPYLENLLHDVVNIYGRTKEYAQEDVAALLIGLGVAEEQNSLSGRLIVAGVMPGYDKAVADQCVETAYGCVYSYLQAEAVGNVDDQARTGGVQHAAY